MIIINIYNAAPDFYLQSASIKNICEKYKSVRKRIIGKSLCGRAITALCIGKPERPVLYAATFHGMEWLNTLFMLTFAEECAAAYESGETVEGVDVRAVLQKHGLAIIPCVNPDGVEIQLNGSNSCPLYKKQIDCITDNTRVWQANARGVDLNHNFNAGWRALKRQETEMGITAPAPTRYGGAKPFSEPETIALRNFCMKNRVCYAIAFHSQGREVYCTYGCTPECAFVLGKTFAELANYKLALPDGIASVGGGFKDWLISYLKTPAITVETGEGKNPLPLSDYQSEYKRIRKALFKCLDI